MAPAPRFHNFFLLTALAFAAGPVSASTAIIVGTNVVAAYTEHPEMTPGSTTSHAGNVTAFRALTSTGGSFAAFCLEPLTPFQATVLAPDVNGNATYDDPTDLSTSLPNYNRVVTLFDKFYAQASVDPTLPASGTPVVNNYRYAFQLALWQLVADNGTVNGDQYKLAPATDAVYDDARFWNANTPMDGVIDYQIPLNSLMPDIDLVIQMLADSSASTPLPKYELKIVNGATSQDMLIAVSAVPEPSGYALLLAGSACLLVARRRRQTT